MTAVVVFFFLVVVIGVTLLGLRQPRNAVAPATPPAGACEARFAGWGLQVLNAMGFTYWLPPLAVRRGGPPGEPPPQWFDAQLVLATTEDSTLVLDCLVAPTDPSELGARYSGTPVTFRVHPRVGLTSVSDVGYLVSRWVDTGSTVGIAVQQQDGMATLSIADADTMVALELEASSA